MEVMLLVLFLFENHHFSNAELPDFEGHYCALSF